MRSNFITLDGVTLDLGKLDQPGYLAARRLRSDDSQACIVSVVADLLVMAFDCECLYTNERRARAADAAFILGHRLDAVTWERFRLLHWYAAHCAHGWKIERVPAWEPAT